ncbi:NAD(P)/FAD-dependent oxidoreductase [Rhodohalobacter sp. 614A]|uniref:NAD(P)/FAD-dependent oxidoreductase n=1 Tax=Rhodohalobacter sp. 614A TaxID=2908649 RepID=UPI001F315403|nr:FAD-dependent oxidoreductase [Rhodohalobacter sp. 614A]
MKKFDFMVVGSGFSGSITAMALKNSGYSVCLVEKEKHPRFAIGESSTPIADMILRDLADQYNLPILKKLSRYGEWQKNYPEIVCGLKRGFSYYQHKNREKFHSDENHSRELLVAASKNDQNSDTNWLRSDVDHFLVKNAVETGVTYFDQTEIDKLSRNANDKKWSVFLDSSGALEEIECNWLIDATGGPNFSAKFFKTESTSTGFETNSSAIYSHFKHVPHWLKHLHNHGFKTSDYPYNPDYSALHHLIEEGWIWMLRFNNDLLSAGILLDHNHNELNADIEPEKQWNTIIGKYPSLKTLFKDAEIAEIPNRYFGTPRLQRRLDKLFGNGWVVLPHTAGFVDPLHSTGIAFTLSGVEKILKLFTSNLSEKDQIKCLGNYQDKVFNELFFIDLLVSISYKTRNHFDLFSASTMLYFIASIRYEQSRLRGEIPDTFLCAGEPEIRELIQQSFNEIKSSNMDAISDGEIQNLIQRIRKRIEPYNSVGLMNPDLKNMYKHTAVEL